MIPHPVSIRILLACLRPCRMLRMSATLIRSLLVMLAPVFGRILSLLPAVGRSLMIFLALLTIKLLKMFFLPPKKLSNLCLLRFEKDSIMILRSYWNSWKTLPIVRRQLNSALWTLPNRRPASLFYHLTRQARSQHSYLLDVTVLTDTKPKNLYWRLCLNAKISNATSVFPNPTSRHSSIFFQPVP